MPAAHSFSFSSTGLYYPPDSLKARACVAGASRLRDYCNAAGVQHATPGKLLLAVGAAQLPALDALRANAAACGVALEKLAPADVAALEPAVHCAGALWSPATGVIDSHGLMQARW